MTDAPTVPAAKPRGRTYKGGACIHTSEACDWCAGRPLPPDEPLPDALPGPRESRPALSFTRLTVELLTRARQPDGVEVPPSDPGRQCPRCGGVGRLRVDNRTVDELRIGGLG